jgi:hypothetical protein
MENVIEKLRELIGDGYEGQAWDEVHEEVDGILDAYKPQGYTTSCVDSEYEDGGRWTNYKTDVYEVKQGDETAYFSVWREVPATELQDGGDFMVGIEEVVPQEVTVIEYISKEAA